MRKMTVLALLVSLVAALAMVALTGCGGGGGKQEAIDAYKEAAASYTEDIQDLDFAGTLTAKADMSGTDVFSIDGAMKMQYKLPEGVSLNTEDPKAIIDSFDKIDLLFELGGTMNAMGESADLTMNVYITDNKIYLDMSGTDTEATKTFFEITPEMKQEILDSIDEAMSEISGSSGSDLSKLKEEFPIENYVTDGSVNGDKVTLTIDLFKVLDDIVAKSATEDGGDVADALNSVSELKKAISNGDIIVEATIDDNKHFTSFKTSFDTDVDLGAAMGGESSADSKMHITFVLDCPTYEVNAGKDVKFPSFDGYKDTTKEMASSLEGAIEEDKADLAA